MSNDEVILKSKGKHFICSLKQRGTGLWEKCGILMSVLEGRMEGKRRHEGGGWSCLIILRENDIKKQRTGGDTNSIQDLPICRGLCNDDDWRNVD